MGKMMGKGGVKIKNVPRTLALAETKIAKMAFIKINKRPRLGIEACKEVKLQPKSQ